MGNKYQHRQGSTVICVTGQDGQPVANQEVAIKQKTGNVMS